MEAPKANIVIVTTANVNMAMDPVDMVAVAEDMGIINP